ncbi:DUF6232 family protein [Micromonospora sp. BRA006-A]|nr:DUF6232 family protein [Micromonospora sp. BRA006-A]
MRALAGLVRAGPRRVETGPDHPGRVRGGGLALTPFLEVPLGWLDRSYERGNRVHELWVQHHGRETMLVRTPDALRFGQIYRAVQRAVEQQTDRR